MNNNFFKACIHKDKENRIKILEEIREANIDLTELRKPNPSIFCEKNPEAISGIPKSLSTDTTG